MLFLSPSASVRVRVRECVSTNVVPSPPPPPPPPDRDDHSRERAPVAPEPEPVLEDINRCRVPREFLERWANEPYFEKAVKGCFVRVARGQGRGGERLYAMAEIVGVVPYKRRYKIVSDKVALVAGNQMFSFV